LSAKQHYVARGDTRNRKDILKNYEPFIHGHIYNIVNSLLGVFTNLRKETISFVISAYLFDCLSVYPHGTIPMSLDRFP
jgi:hypothetical protein